MSNDTLNTIKQRKILLIDDNPFILELVKNMLRGEDAILLTTPSGAIGYEMACEEQPNLIILDRKLKNDENGDDILCQIKANMRTRNIPVTMLSGDDNKELIKKSIAYGAEDYIIKPFSIKTLKEKIERLTRIGSVYNDPHYYVNKTS